MIIVALIVVPVIEIALFVLAGDSIGFWPTMALVVVSAIIGGHVLQTQGRSTLRRAQNPADMSELTTALTDGAMLAASGLLMITPGFFTDIVGLLLLVPPVRRWLAARLSPYFRGSRTGFHARSNTAGASSPPPRSSIFRRSPWRRNPEDGNVEEAVVLPPNQQQEPNERNPS